MVRASCKIPFGARKPLLLKRIKDLHTQTKISYKLQFGTNIQIRLNKGIVNRSRWPTGLKRGFAAYRLLELGVRIPPGTWMFVLCVVEEYVTRGQRV